MCEGQCCGLLREGGNEGALRDKEREDHLLCARGDAREGGYCAMACAKEDAREDHRTRAARAKEDAGEGDHRAMAACAKDAREEYAKACAKEDAREDHRAMAAPAKEDAGEGDHHDGFGLEKEKWLYDVSSFSALIWNCTNTAQRMTYLG